MQNQRQSSRTFSFYLELDSKGCWQWHWWSSLPTAANPAAAMPSATQANTEPATGQPASVTKAWKASCQLSGACTPMLNMPWLSAQASLLDACWRPQIFIICGKGNLQDLHDIKLCFATRPISCLSEHTWSESTWPDSMTLLRHKQAEQSVATAAFT